ncbi:unnamed protein product [Rhizoctonia solani]|uniref:Jacalin-type lectin domain-containing protein n=1 Tax=Rhizoctonia solani TaxID=456999 RepID=A0A8H3E950_9AGAM|nr:unnamed protein product [Rhizoctonia solani]
MSPRPDELKDRLIDESDFKLNLPVLHGIAFGGSAGPYKCSQQVAQLRPDAISSIQLCQDIEIEDIYPANEHEARFIHLGWPSPSTLPSQSWDILTPGTQASPPLGTWVCRRLIVHRWRISIQSKDLIAMDPFVEAVEVALENSNTSDKIRALRDVFATWGDMIPLAVVVGASLATTGALGPNQSLTGSVSTFRPPDRGPDMMQIIDQSLDITGNFERRFASRIQVCLIWFGFEDPTLFFLEGGYPDVFSNSGFNAWLTSAVNIDSSPTWEVVKVNRAAPIIDLLPKNLRQQINQLLSYTNIVSRSPSVGTQMPSGFDGASLGVKGIKQINIWHNSAGVQDISFVYVDRAVAGPYGFGRNNQMYDSFVLAQDEFITGCFVWYTSSVISSLQFVKNTSQVSAFYGAQTSAGDPVIFNAGGNALLGLSGNCNTQNLLQAQAVWRSDVKVDTYRVTSTATIGVANAALFNDAQYLGDPINSRISKIRFRSSASVVAGLQVTYSHKQNGNEVHQETPARGTDAGPIDSWVLADGENITQVKGRCSGAVVYQLEFVTNKGNTKRFGQEAGEVFNLVPPNKDMVLYYLLGKRISCSAGYVQSLTFVWGAPPL